MSIFTDNLKKLMRDNNVTYAALSKTLGISKNGLKYWESMGNTPSGEILIKIASYFGTTVESLIGQANEQNPQNSDEEELVGIFRKLSTSGKRQLMGKAYELLDAQVASKAGDKISPPDINMVSAVLDRGIKK